MISNQSRPWLDEILFSEKVWNYWWNLGSRRSSGKRTYPSSEYLDEDSHEIGNIGELCFGRLVGQKPASDVGPLGDAGFDFENVDVKATPYAPPWLKVRIEKATPGRYYALVLIDVERKAAKYIGHADYDTLVKNGVERIALRESRSTKHTGLKRDDRYGPPSYIVRSGLNPDLPPGYAYKPRPQPGR